MQFRRTDDVAVFVHMRGAADRFLESKNGIGLWLILIVEDHRCVIASPHARRPGLIMEQPADNGVLINGMPICNRRGHVDDSSHEFCAESFWRRQIPRMKCRLIQNISVAQQLRCSRAVWRMLEYASHTRPSLSARSLQYSTEAPRPKHQFVRESAARLRRRERGRPLRLADRFRTRPERRARRCRGRRGSGA